MPTTTIDIAHGASPRPRAFGRLDELRVAARPGRPADVGVRRQERPKAGSVLACAASRRRPLVITNNHEVRRAVKTAELWRKLAVVAAAPTSEWPTSTQPRSRTSRRTPPDWRWTKLPKPLRGRREAGGLALRQSVHAGVPASVERARGRRRAGVPRAGAEALARARPALPYHLAAARTGSLRSPMSPFEHHRGALRADVHRALVRHDPELCGGRLHAAFESGAERVHPRAQRVPPGLDVEAPQGGHRQAAAARPADDLPLHHWWVVHTEAAVALLERGGRERRLGVGVGVVAASLVRAPPSARRRRARRRAARRRRPTTTTTTTRRASPAWSTPAGWRRPARGAADAARRGWVAAGGAPRARRAVALCGGAGAYDVPVGDGDRISVPPLSGFVMNRVGNDYLEKLLYEVFVPTTRPDRRPARCPLAAAPLVTAAVSVACRLASPS